MADSLPRDPNMGDSMHDSENYIRLVQRLTIGSWSPPKAFVAAVAALLPDGMTSDSLGAPDPLGNLLTTRNSTSEGTVWSTFGVVDGDVLRVRVQSSDVMWEWQDDDSLDQPADELTAWIRPMSMVRGIAVQTATLRTGRGFSLSAQWAIDVGDETILLPDPEATNPNTIDEARRIVSAIRELWAARAV